MTTKTAAKTMIATAALALGLLGAGPARAWEPDPILGPDYYTGVVRVLDFGFPLGGALIVALSDDPASLCAAQRARNGESLLAQFGPAWVPFGNLAASAASQWLSTLMWAKAQNSQVRVFLRATLNEDCVIVSFRTCADAAACAYPPPPAGP
jgi:hypothetical protein